VPFADLPTQQVAFYLVTGQFSTTFDNANILFANESDHGETQNAARGADSALINVAQGSYIYSPTTVNAIVQTLDIRGDGASFVSNLWVAKSITSTGPLGDVSVNQVLGISNLSAPSIFGSISSYGPITGTVQTTGIRLDPVAATASTASADFGSVYVTSDSNGNAIVASSTITTDANGKPTGATGSGIMGTILSRGNLFSELFAYGGISGTIAVAGDIGANSTLLNIASPTRVGGIITDFSPDTGKIVALGRMIGDLSLLGGLIGGGSVAIQGGILGNVIINGVAAGTAFISGGSIGDPTLGTTINFGTNQGIIAASGAVYIKNNLNTTPGYFSQNDAGTPDGAVIDSIFTDPLAMPIAGLDYLVPDDLLGLSYIVDNLGRLHVAGGRLSL
jgi:hypothetical protein